MIAAKSIFDREVLVMHLTNTERPGWHRGAFAATSILAHGLIILVLAWGGPVLRAPAAAGPVDAVTIDAIDEADDTSTDISVAKEDPRPSKPVEGPPTSERSETSPAVPEPRPQIPAVPPADPREPVTPKPVPPRPPRAQPTSSVSPGASVSPSAASTGAPSPSATGDGAEESAATGVRAERNLIAAFLHELPFFAGAMDVWARLGTGDGGRLRVTLKVSPEGKVIEVHIEDAGQHRALHEALERTTLRLTRGTYGLDKSFVTAGSATFVVHATLADVDLPDDPGGGVSIKRNIEKRTAEFTTTTGRRVAFELERLELTKD